MENTEKNIPQNGEKKSSSRNRHHRHRKPHHAPNSGDANVNNVPNTTEGEQNTAPKSNETKSSSGNNRSQHNGNHHKKNRNGDRRNRSQGGRGGYETRGPIDPYRDAEETAAALAELRAMIVLKSADEKTEETVESTPLPTASEETAPVADTTESTPVDAESHEDAATRPLDDSPLPPAPETETPIAPEEQPIEVVGIRFRSAGKIYYFDPHGLTVKKGDYAIVETARGPEFGDVALSNRKISPKDVVAPLRPMLRIATREDVAHNEENRKKEERAFEICREKIAEHKLEMKLIEAQYAFDNSKLLFYFTSDGRVDFRDLVKDLASVFRTRIELRQIGIRDEAKMLGGLGACGRSLCCSTFLPDFAQVSIKMAKEQNLSLNSAKISGLCGRLMCCLRYESEVYAAEARLTPKPDTWVKTEDGVGVVVSANPLAGTVNVSLRESPESAPKTYHRDSVTVVEKEAEEPRERPAETTANRDEATSNNPKRTSSRRSGGNRTQKKPEQTKKEGEKS